MGGLQDCMATSQPARTHASKQALAACSQALAIGGSCRLSDCSPTASHNGEPASQLASRLAGREAGCLAGWLAGWLIHAARSVTCHCCCRWDGTEWCAPASRRTRAAAAAAAGARQGAAQGLGPRGLQVQHQAACSSAATRAVQQAALGVAPRHAVHEVHSASCAPGQKLPASVQQAARKGRPSQHDACQPA